MPTRLVFRCQFCPAEPDDETRSHLEAQLLELRFGEYVDAGRAGWLMWHGRGIYGPHRYACAEHRVTLRSFLRRHYGTVGWHPKARVLGDVPPEVRSQLDPPSPPRRRTTRAQLWMARGLAGRPPPEPGSPTSRT